MVLNMTFEDMQKFLNKVQQEKTETKIMNALLACYQQVKNLEAVVIELQKKVNEIISNWNTEIEGAAPVKQEEDTINNDIAAAKEKQNE